MGNVSDKAEVDVFISSSFLRLSFILSFSFIYLFFSFKIQIYFYVNFGIKKDFATLII